KVGTHRRQSSRVASRCEMQSKNEKTNLYRKQDCKMASQTKGRESWTEENSPRTTIRESSPLKLSRVFRFVDPQTSASQISDFPDSNPSGDTTLEVRMKHFTEIENYTFLGY